MYDGLGGGGCYAPDQAGGGDHPGTSTSTSCHSTSAGTSIKLARGVGLYLRQSIRNANSDPPTIGASTRDIGNGNGPEVPEVPEAAASASAAASKDGTGRRASPCPWRPLFSFFLFSFFFLPSSSPSSPSSDLSLTGARVFLGPARSRAHGPQCRHDHPGGHRRGETN